MQSFVASSQPYLESSKQTARTVGVKLFNIMLLQTELLTKRFVTFLLQFILNLRDRQMNLNHSLCRQIKMKPTLFLNQTAKFLTRQ